MDEKVNLTVEYEIEVKDRNGKLLRSLRGNSKSLLKNFMLWLRQWFTIYSGASYAENWTATTTGGTTATFPYNKTSCQGVWGYLGGSTGNATVGIVVGSGDTAVTPDDYTLASKINHGTEAGQLLHEEQTVEAVQVSGNEVSFRVTRTFTNNSGGDVTGKELGMMLSITDQSGGGKRLLLLRDVLESAITVQDGKALTVRYTFKVTV